MDFITRGEFKEYFRLLKNILHEFNDEIFNIQKRLNKIEQAYFLNREEGEEING